MSTAVSTHHRISNPLATAAAVLVIIAGAGVIGVAVSQDDSATPPTTPIGMTHGRHGGTSWNPGDRVGMGDFTQSQKTTHEPPLKGGHSTIGLP
jgi:hypothetical protein